MRILGITETCDLGSMYLRLLGDGHEVRISVSEPLACGTMAGMVPRTDDWRAELGWVREAGSEGVILFEAVGFGSLQDELRRDGYRVIGGSAVGDRLESDRAHAQRLFAELGVRAPASRSFTRAADAIADIRSDPRRCVFKLNASEGETFVGDLPDGSDVAALLRVRPPASGQSFILMDAVEGVETGVGAYFNGERFLAPACLDWEHKRFFDGDMGELTGEMGTVASFEGSETLFRATLEPLEPLLRDAGHVGYVNLNTIINAEGIWPLELTCRFGYPGFAVLEPLQALGWGELFSTMLDPNSDRFPHHPGFSLAVVLTTPPFPWSRHEVDCPVGFPVTVGDVEPEHLHLGEVGVQEGELVTSGLYGWTAVVTGTGPDIATSKQAAYRRAVKLRTADLRYRTDIGDRQIAGELQMLSSWGWLNSSPPSRIESQIVR